MLRLLVVLLLAAPACGQPGTLPNIFINLTLPDLDSVNLTVQACQAVIQNAGTVCFGGDPALASANVSQLITVAGNIIPQLAYPFNIVPALSVVLEPLGEPAIIGLFENLCTKQECIAAFTGVIQTCLPFQTDNVREVLVLLVNFLTDFVCSRGGSQNEFCLLQLLDADLLTNFQCAFVATVTRVCMESCKMNVSKVVENFGCCYNNFVLPFEETNGINATVLSTFAKTILDVCGLTRPTEFCTTAVNNPLIATPSPTSSSRAVSTAGVLTFVLMLYAMYWQM